MWTTAAQPITQQSRRNSNASHPDIHLGSSVQLFRFMPVSNSCDLQIVKHVACTLFQRESLKSLLRFWCCSLHSYLTNQCLMECSQTHSKGQSWYWSFLSYRRLDAMEKTWKLQTGVLSLLPPWEGRPCSDVCSPWTQFACRYWCNIENAVRMQTLYHSTEAALHKICNDIAVAIESGFATAVCLLDFSAAFDTVGHGILARHEKHTASQDRLRTDWVPILPIDHFRFILQTTNHHRFHWNLEFYRVRSLVHSCLLSILRNSLIWLLDGL